MQVLQLLVELFHDVCFLPGGVFCLLLPVLHRVQESEDPGERYLPVLLGLVPALCVLPQDGGILLEGLHPLLSADLGILLPALPDVLLHQVLEAPDPAALGAVVGCGATKLFLNLIEKPLVHQVLLLPAVLKELPESRLLLVHLVDDVLPLPVVDPVLGKALEVVLPLGGVVHVKGIEAGVRIPPVLIE